MTYPEVEEAVLPREGHEARWFLRNTQHMLLTVGPTGWFGEGSCVKELLNTILLK